MKPRARRRLLVVAVVVGLPALLLAAGVWYITAGRLAQDLERAWAERYPGLLTVGSVTLEGLDAVALEGLEWSVDGATLAQLPRLRVSGAPLRGVVEAVQVDDLSVQVDAQHQGHWQTLLEQLLADFALSEPDPERPPPALNIAGMRVHIAGWQLRDMALQWEGTADGAGEGQFSAQGAAGSWQGALSRTADGALSVHDVALKIDLQTGYQALQRLIGSSKWPSAAALPAEVALSAKQLQLHPEGWLEGELQLVPDQPWFALAQWDFAFSGDGEAQQLQLALQHELGRSEWQLQHHWADQAQELRLQGAPLPLAAMAGEAWPLPWAAPQGVQLTGSQIRRDHSGAWDVRLHITPDQPWLGLRRLALRAALPDLLTPLARGQQRRSRLRLSLDSGHGRPLAFTLSADEQRSAHTPAITRSYQLQAVPGAVPMATVLAVPRAMGLLQNMPLWAAFLFPSKVDFAGTDVQLTMPDVRGQWRASWDGGHLNSEITGAMIDWRLAPLSLKHAVLGEFHGTAHFNESLLRLSWDHLAPNYQYLRHALGALAWPEHLADSAEAVLNQLPQGQLRIFSHDFPVHTSMALRGPDGARLSARVQRDEDVAVSAEQLPLSLLKSFVRVEVLSAGHLRSGSARLTADKDGSWWPRHLQARVEEARGNWQDWGAAAQSLRADVTLARDANGLLVPEAAALEVIGGQGQRQGWRVTLPPYRLSLQQEGGQRRWAADLEFIDIAGRVSATLAGDEWTQALPIDGELAVHGLDLAATAQALRIVDEADRPRLLLLPEDFRAVLDGQLRYQYHNSRFQVAISEGQLSQLRWQPWMSDGAVSLSGELQLAEGVLSGALDGGLAAGDWQVLGSPIAAADQQISYAIRFAQQRERLQVSELSLDIAHPEQPPAKQPLVVLSGERHATGPAAAQLLLDQIDIGWLTKLPDLGIPENLVLDGRVRGVIDLNYDAQQILTTSGWLLPTAVEVNLADGELILENMSGALQLPERRWRLDNQGLQPLAEE